MRKPLSLTLILICILLSLPACSKDTGEGKAFHVPIDAAPQRLDPAVASAPDELLVVNNCFEGLVRQDANGEIIPGAAKSWSVSPDGLTYTFALREDTRWHLQRDQYGNAVKDIRALLGEEGAKAFDTQVTAADFLFGLRRALLPATNAPGAADLYAIRGARAVHEGKQPVEKLSVRAIDRFTLEITLEKPSAGFLYALTQSAAMPCNQAYFEATKGRYGLSVFDLLCNGPFFLSYWDEALVKLRKNGDYSGAAPVAPAVVNLRPQPDCNLRLERLGQEDGYDAAVVPAALVTEDVLAETNALLLRNATLSLIFNCGRAPLDNPNLRVALCAALDAGQLGVSAPTGLLPDCVRVGDEALRSLTKPPKQVAHDPARARKLLRASGAQALSLTLLCPPERELLCRRALQQWQNLFGLSLSVQIDVPEDAEDYARRLRRGDFDLAVATLQAQSSFALQALAALTQPGGAGNPMRCDSPKLRGILEGAQALETARGVADACLAAEEFMLQNGMAYPLAAQASYVLFAPGVDGFAVSPAGDQIFFAGAVKTGD